MKVFVVEGRERYEDSWVVGVFSTEERAQAVMAAEKQKAKPRYEFRVTQYELDEWAQKAD